MKYYFLIIGILCVLYYLILVWYSRKLRSTFAVFWLFAGGVHLLTGCAPLPVYVYMFLTAVCAVCWLSLLIVESRIISAMLSDSDRKADCIIILGAQVKGTKITDSLRRRLDKSIDYLRRFPDTRVIVSGGQGPGEEITEADAMAEYLIRHSVDREQIVKEDRSTSTRENLKYSRKYTDPEKDVIGIVTNGFHMYRALLIAKQEGYRNIYRIPASSNPVFQMNYLMREFFAVVHAWINAKAK